MYYNWYDEGHLSDPFSFPSVVQMHLRYYHFYVKDNRVYNPGVDIVCMGVIINKYSVLTAASCLPQEFTLHPYLFNGAGFQKAQNVSINVPFEFTDTFPDWTTIIHVFVGLYDYINYGDKITPTERIPVDKVFTVRAPLNYFSFYFLIFKTN